MNLPFRRGDIVVCVVASAPETHAFAPPLVFGGRYIVESCFWGRHARSLELVPGVALVERPFPGVGAGHNDAWLAERFESADTFDDAVMDAAAT